MHCRYICRTSEQLRNFGLCKRSDFNLTLDCRFNRTLYDFYFKRREFACDTIDCRVELFAGANTLVEQQH